MPAAGLPPHFLSLEAFYIVDISFVLFSRIVQLITVYIVSVIDTIQFRQVDSGTVFFRTFEITITEYYHLPSIPLESCFTYRYNSRENVDAEISLKVGLLFGLG